MAIRTTSLSKIIDAIRSDDLTAMQKLLSIEVGNSRGTGVVESRGTGVVERVLMAGATDPDWRGEVVGSQAFKRPANEAVRMLGVVFQGYAQAQVSKSITPPVVEMFEQLGRWVSKAANESEEQKQRVAVTGELIEQHWHLLDRANREAVVGRLLTLSGAGGFNLVVRWLTEDQRLEKLSDNGAFLRPISLLRTSTVFIDIDDNSKGAEVSDNRFEGWKHLVGDLLATAPLPKILRTDLTPKAFEDAMGRGNFGNNDKMASFLLSALRPHLKPDFKKLADNLMVGPVLEDIIQRADASALTQFLLDSPDIAPIEGWAEFEKKAIAHTANVANAVLEHESANMRKTRAEHFQSLADFAQAVLDTCEKRAPQDEQAAKASARALIDTLQRLRDAAMRNNWYRQLECVTLDADIKAEGIDRLEHLLANPWNEVLRAAAKRRNPEWHDGSTPEGLLARLKDEAAPAVPRKKR